MIQNNVVIDPIVELNAMNVQNSPRNIVNSEQLSTLWKEKPYEDMVLDKWDSIKWADVYSRIQSYRERIYETTQLVENAVSEYDKIKHLRNLRQIQKALVYDPANLIFSVRRVTQINKGRNTPGLDNFFVLTKEDRYRLVLIIRKDINIKDWNPSPVKRVYIPKKNGKLRPLGIPIIIDRIIQMLVKNALEPEWEFKADLGSYGFRPGRCTADAIEKIHTTLTTKDNSLPKKQWILDAEIKKSKNCSIL